MAIAAKAPGAAEKHVEDSVRAEVSHAFLVKVRRNGYIEAIEFDREAKGLGCGILRSLIAATSFVGPEGLAPDWRGWTSVEADQNGVYKAHYRQIGPGMFQKTKPEYSYVEMEARLRFGNKSPHVTIVSSAKLRRDGDGVLQSVDSEEHLEVPVGDASFKSDSHVTLRLKQRDTVQLAALDRSRLVATALFAAGSNPVQEDTPTKKRKLVAGATLSQLVSDLERTPATPENRIARWDLTHRMSALFDLEPEHLTEMREKLKGKLAPDDADMLLAAVSDSKAPEAQKTLASVAGDADGDPRLRTAAAQHLGLQEQPTERTINSLTTIAQESTDDQTKKAATLALGSTARRGRDGAETSGAAQQAVEGLIGAAGPTNDPDSRRVALEALGNAADPSSLAVITQALHDPDPVIRRAAVLALRMIPGAEVDGLIVDTLSDPDVGVRIGALMALADRPLTPALVHAIIGVAKTEQDAGMRLQAVQLLARRAGQNPDVIAALQWSRDNDPSPDVRKAAASALAPAPKGPPTPHP
jgi:HEAT repeat protein